MTVDATAEEQRRALIEQYAAMSDAEAAKAIHADIIKTVGAYGDAAVATAEKSMLESVIQYKQENALHVTGFADVLVRNQVQAGGTIGQDGNVQYGASGQMHVGDLGDASFYAGGGVGADKNGVNNASAWVNVIGKPIDAGPAYVIPVSQAAANKSLDGGEMGLGNASAMAGTVINPKGTESNIAVLASGTLDGKNAGVFVDYSHDFHANKDWTITPHAGVSQSIIGADSTAISGGVRAHNPHFFNETTGLGVEATASSGNLQADNSGASVGLQAQVTFGNAPSKKAASPLDEALSQYTTGHAANPAPANSLIPDSGNTNTQAAQSAAVNQAAAPSSVQAKIDDHVATQGYPANAAGATSGAPTSPPIVAPVREPDPMVEASEKYYALSDNPAKQAAFVERMAANVVKNAPGADKQGVAEYLKEEFAAIHSQQQAHQV